MFSNFIWQNVLYLYTSTVENYNFKTLSRDIIENPFLQYKYINQIKIYYITYKLTNKQKLWSINLYPANLHVIK